MKTIVLFVLLLASMHLVSAGVCGPQVVDGNTFDLSALVTTAGNPDHTLRESQGADIYDYWFNLCQPVVNDNSNCGTGGSCFQKKTTDAGCQKLAGTQESDMKWELLDATDASKGVKLTVGGGQAGCGSIRQVEYQISCDPSATSSNPTEITETKDASGSGTCHYVVKWASVYGCLGGGGMSGGWAFFLVVTIGTIVYCAVGMIFKNQKQGLTGIEMVPNIDFWRALPGHVKDGNVYLFNKIFRRGESYQTVA